MSINDDAPIDGGRPDDEGTPEQGSAQESTVPNPETGVGIGAGDESSFEPEEDPEAVPEDDEG